MDVCPGLTMEMTPPQAHMSLEELFSAGNLFTKTVGAPGAQGATVLGTQGAGVKTTGGGRLVAGFNTLLHMPNGIILLLGLKSMIVAIACEVLTVLGGRVSVDGATPKVHCSIAPPQTHIAILTPQLALSKTSKNAPYFLPFFRCFLHFTLRV